MTANKAATRAKQKEEKPAPKPAPEQRSRGAFFGAPDAGSGSGVLGTESQQLNRGRFLGF